MRRVPASFALLAPFALLPLLGTGNSRAGAPPPAAASAVPTLAARPVAVPDGEGGIGFDDLAFVPALGRVVVPAGRTGRLDLFDPATRRATEITGFSSGATGGQGHGEGTTSADFGRGLLFAVDRTARRLDVVDPAARKIVAGVPLEAGPDYVRWVEATDEIWVTEPEAERIEVFSLPAGPAPTPVHRLDIAVPGGPESLVVDERRGRAYTNLWQERTVPIDLRSHATAGSWPNGCAGARGLALDPARGFLFVGCAEGAASVLDVAHGGARLDRLAHGSGVDILAYDAGRRHLYLPGGRSATLAVLGVSDDGKLTLLATAGTARGAHCATVDDRGQVWLCDPRAGRLLVVDDSARPLG